MCLRRDDDRGRSGRVAYTEAGQNIVTTKSHAMKQAIIYCRFSPRPNAEECTSNEHQERRCREYCRRKGYHVVRVFQDDAVSGGVLDRPKLSEAIDSLHAGHVLVVDNSDRLARDMLVSLTIRHQVDRAGAKVEFADGSPDSTTAEGELMQNILAAFAAYERRRIRERTAAGLARKQAAGEWLGRPPIGFRLDRNTRSLVEDEKEQHAIEWIAGYAMKGLPATKIAALVTREFGPCRGKPWTAKTVRKIVAQGPGRNVC